MSTQKFNMTDTETPSHQNRSIEIRRKKISIVSKGYEGIRLKKCWSSYRGLVTLKVSARDTQSIPKGDLEG